MLTFETLRRSTAPIVALLIGLACAPAMEPVGVSTGGKIAPVASSVAPRASAWAEGTALTSLSGWTRANTKRFPSTGHWFGKYDADVFVNEVARAPYGNVAPGTSASVGAKIAKVHLTRDGVAGPVLAMEKEAAGWIYVEMDAAMRVQRRGRLSPCVDCHTHVASQDELFGVPSTGR